jgi:hypothetical protein
MAQQCGTVRGVQVDITIAVDVEDATTFAVRGHERSAERGVDARRGRDSTWQVRLRRDVQALSVRRQRLHAKLR